MTEFPRFLVAMSPVVRLVSRTDVATKLVGARSAQQAARWQLRAHRTVWDTADTFAFVESFLLCNIRGILHNYGTLAMVKRSLIQFRHPLSFF